MGCPSAFANLAVLIWYSVKTKLSFIFYERKIKKKSSSSVSGILYPENFGISVIYPGCTSRYSSNGLPLAAPSGFRSSRLQELPGRFLAGHFFPTTVGNRDVHGLSTHKVYPAAMSPLQRVSSYLTFSPLPLAGRLFSVALSVPPACAKGPSR
jgi:hypothetical protein